MSRVAISSLTLVPGVSGGTESFLRNLCAALHEVGRNDYTVFAPTIAPDSGTPLETTVVPSYRASFSIGGRLAAMLEGVVAPHRTGRALERASPDVLHFPLTINTPRLRAPGVVTTIHDLQHESLPHLFSRGELLYRKLAYRDAVRRSDLIIAVSEHCRQKVVETFGIDMKKTRCIYNGVDSARFTPGTTQRQPFLYYPANAWAHKNHSRLFAAMELVRLRRPEMKLVLTGVGHEPAKLPAYVTSLGRVPAAKVVELYHSASAMVFPSLYEGFGMPLIEAMASGCPVASSNATCLPEIAGGAAELFDPMDPDAIATAILRVLENPDTCVQRGFVRAREFSWIATARQHDAVYDELGSRVAT